MGIAIAGLSIKDERTIGMDKLIASGIVPVFETDKGNPAVDARTLHKGLGVGRDFSNWIKDRFEKYGFIEGESYSPYLADRSDGLPGKPKTEYVLTLDCAKEIAMAESTEQGHLVRQYFIQVEKDWNSPDKLMARALQIASAKLNETIDYSKALEKRIESEKPKVLFADSVAGSKTSILVGDLAKILKQNGINIGGTRLFEWLRANEYLIARKGRDHNSPSQKSMKLGLMEVKETAIDHSSGFTEAKKTSLITGKGQLYFINKFLLDRDA